MSSTAGQGKKSTAKKTTAKKTTAKKTTAKKKPTPSWLDHEEVVGRVKQLLIDGGIPLEANVARRCQSFAAKSTSPNEELFISAERVVYSSLLSEESVLRELDQNVRFYTELDLGYPLGIQLQVEIPIECKHRKGLAVFGYSEGALGEHVTIPITSGFVQSQLLRHLDHSRPEFMKNARLSLISLLKLEDGIKPVGLIDENLIYKAGAALYDFVSYEVSEAEAYLDLDDLIEHLEVEEKWEESKSAKGISDWLIANKPLVKRYNELRFGSRTVHHLLTLHFPVVCVDAPLYEVTLNRRGNIDGFREQRILFSSVRTPGWLGRTLSPGARGSAESLVTIINTDNLNWFLGEMNSWFRKLIQILQGVDSETVQIAPIESSLKRTLQRPDYSSYRSDLGFI